MSEETPRARDAIDAVIRRVREQSEREQVPFDPNKAKERARDSAVRHDQRNDGTRKPRG